MVGYLGVRYSPLDFLRKSWASVPLDRKKALTSKDIRRPGLCAIAAHNPDTLMTIGQRKDRFQQTGPYPGHQIGKIYMAILMKDLDTIREELSRRTLEDIPGYGDQIVSPRRAIHELAPILLEKKKNGFTTAALVAMLADLQIIIKGPTLNRYLKECQEERKKVRPKHPNTKAADGATKGINSASTPKKAKVDSTTTDRGTAFHTAR